MDKQLLFLFYLINEIKIKKEYIYNNIIAFYLIINILK